MGPSSNHDQAEAGLVAPKAHPHFILIGGKAHSILIGGKTVRIHQKLKLLFHLTGDKTEVQTWTKPSLATSTIRTKTHFVIIGIK